MRLALPACALAFTFCAAALPARAEDARVSVFPPLYRDAAHATRAVRPAAELATTPQPVRSGEARETAGQRVAEAR
jgi:hypothetical protein